MMTFFKWLDYTIGNILTPEVIAILGSIIGTFWHMLKQLDNRIDNEHKELFKSLNERIDKQDELLNERIDKQDELSKKRYRDTTKEIVRLQILEGIESRRLSVSEVQYFYEKYKKLGGNSFVTKKVQEYIKSLELNDTDGNKDNNI